MRWYWPVYRYGWMPTRGSWLDQGEKHYGWFWAQVRDWRIGWGWDR